MALDRIHFPSVLFTALLMAGAAQFSLSHAADTGSVVVGGQVSNSTCNIVISDVGAVGAQGTKFLNLGTILPASVTSVSGTDTGLVAAVFSVKSTSPDATPCNLGENNTGNWDLALNLTSSQIGTVSSTKVLLNGVPPARGGTNAVVLLKGGVGTNLSDASNVLSLVGDAIYSGTLMSGAANASAITAKANESIVLAARFAQPSVNTAPTPGIYSQTIPLLAVYK